MTGESLASPGWPVRAVRAATGFLERRPLVASTSLVVLMLGGTIGLLHPGYQSSDDASMTLYAAGVGIRETGDAHLLFMHAWIGWLLNSLYRVRPDVPWYAIFLYTVLAFAGVVVLDALRGRRGTAETFIIFVVLFVVTLGTYAQELQFTLVAMYCTTAGWLTAARAGTDGQAARPGTIAALLALILGASVRPIGFAIASLLCAPLVLYAWAAATSAARRHLAAIGVLALGSAAMLYATNAWYYRADPAWADFYEYNALRANFNDFQVIRHDARTQRIFEAAGWSRNDYLMIKNWFYADPRTFSREKMKRIVASIGPYGTDLVGKETARRVFRAFATFHWLGTAIILGWIGALWGWRRVGPVVATLGAAAVVIVAVSVLLKPMPPRISMTMAGLCALAAAFLASPRGDLRARPRWRQVLSITMTLAVLGYAASSVLRDVGRANARERQQRAFEADVSRLAPRPTDLYVAWADAFPMKDIAPLTPFTQLRKMRLLPLGAELGTPHVAGTMRDFGIDDLYLALASRPGVYLISDATKNRLYVDYMREKYRLDVAVEPRFEGRTFTVYAVRSA